MHLIMLRIPSLFSSVPALNHILSSCELPLWERCLSHRPGGFARHRGLHFSPALHASDSCCIVYVLRVTFSVKCSYFDIRHWKQFPGVKHLSWNVHLQHLLRCAVEKHSKIGLSLSQHYATFDMNHTLNTHTWQNDCTGPRHICVRSAGKRWTLLARVDPKIASGLVSRFRNSVNLESNPASSAE